MKICIWISKIFELGGTKRVVTLLANELSKEYDVTIMTLQDPSTEDRSMYQMKNEVHVDYINTKVFIDKRKTPPFILRFIIKKANAKTGMFNRKSLTGILGEATYPKKSRDKWIHYLNQKEYDIIISIGGISLQLAMMAPELKAKTIGWQHNCYEGYLDVPNVVFWKKECLLQENLPKLDKYVVLSEYDQRDYRNLLGIESEVKTNPRSFVSSKKSSGTQKRFLIAARFVYAKGLDLMMESFEEFCRQNEEWQLDIIGAGELFDQIKADASARKIDHRVNFAGYTNDAESHYLQSSVFLLPSRWEGWPMVIMEAFEFGLPVIAYHTGAMDLIIEDGKTGLLVEPFDTHEFCQAMLSLAEKEELRLQMRNNAISKSQDFKIEDVVKDWNDLFARL
ncbi:MAG: glycosyltransferase [Lachnospiraceae bacterium]